MPLQHSISKAKASKILSGYSEYIGSRKGYDLWLVNSNKAIVQLPVGNYRIDIEVFIDILLHQVDLGIWEIDYILGDL